MEAALAVTERPKRGNTLTRLVGARIAFCREHAGLNQTVTSRRAGLSASHLCNMEKGERSIDVEKLGVIARAIGCKVVDFLPVSEGGTPLSEQLRLLEDSGEDPSP